MYAEPQSLGALTGGLNSWGSGRSSHEQLNAAAVAAVAAAASPSQGPPLGALSGSGSGSSLAGDFQRGAGRVSLGPVGSATGGFFAGAHPAPINALSLRGEGSSDGLAGTSYNNTGVRPASQHMHGSTAGFVEL